MGDKTGIEWTDATWNPVRGCTRASEGCRNCYAEIMAARFSKPGQWGHGFAEIVRAPDGKLVDHRWTGRVEVIKSALTLPLFWTAPRKIFANSTSDLFHERLAAADIARVFAVMAVCRWHQFQVLTKRASRLPALLGDPAFWDEVAEKVEALVVGFGGKLRHLDDGLPEVERTLARRPAVLPNVWIGVSIEDQATADARVPELLKAPAAIRWVSAEPLLGPIDLAWALSRNAIEIAAGFIKRGSFSPGLETLRSLDWVVAGYESGFDARPRHPDIARGLRDQCAAAGVPFLFKQWGQWHPSRDHDPVACASGGRGQVAVTLAGEEEWRPAEAFRNLAVPGWEGLCPVGKHASGRVLDGVLHDAYPDLGRA